MLPIMRNCMIAFLLLWNYGFGAIQSGPRGGTFIAGHDVVLECIIEDGDAAMWLDEEALFTVYNGSNYYGGEKYRNFHLESNGAKQYSMRIRSIEVGDEGTYGCRVGGDASKLAKITVEVPPTVQITRPSSASGVMNVIENQPTVIVCEAHGAKPPVSLFWMINNHLIHQEKYVTKFNVSRESQHTYSYLMHVPSKNDETITCISSGQRVAPPVVAYAVLNIQASPKCTLRFVTKATHVVVICKCKSNPIVEKQNYTIKIGNETFHQQYAVPFDKSANISCYGTNEVGTGYSGRVFYTVNITDVYAKHMIMLAIILTTVVITFLGMCLCGVYIRQQRKRKRGPYFRFRTSKKRTAKRKTYPQSSMVKTTTLKGSNIPLATFSENGDPQETYPLNLYSAGTSGASASAIDCDDDVSSTNSVKEAEVT